MAGLKELTEKLKASPELAADFKDIKDVDGLIAKAKEHGFEITKDEIAEASNVSAEELSKAAGGSILLSNDNIINIFGLLALI